MRIVLGHDALVAQWMAEKLGQSEYRPPYTAMGVIDHEGTLRGGILFSDWNGSNLEITIYLPNAIQRGLIRGAYQYAFGQAGASRLTAKTRRGNVKMRKLLPRLGFKFEGVMKRYYGATPQDDALMFRLDPSEALKWM